MKEQVFLPLGEVVVGMQLAEAVCDSTGNVLVPAGAEITESMLRSLQRREVAMLRVVRDIVEDPVAQVARQAALADGLSRLFRKAGEGEATHQLFQAVLAYRQEQSA